MSDGIKEKKKFSETLKDNLQKITIIIVSIIYIVQGVFTIAKKDTSIIDILGSISFSIIVGVVISSSMNSMGLKDGRKSQAFVNSMKKYGETKELATPFFDKISAWCEYKNSIDLEAKRKEIIQNAGLKWKLYKIGYYNENKPSDNDKLKALEKAKHCKIEKITSQELLSDLPSEKYMKKRFGEGEKEYKTRNLFVDLLSKLLIGCVCGMYSLMPLLTEENINEQLASVLWNTMQISMWLAFGMIKYSNSKSFIEDEYRQTHIIQKTEYLNEFIVTVKNNPGVINEYDDEEDVEKFLEELVKQKGELKNEK